MTLNTQQMDASKTLLEGAAIVERESDDGAVLNCWRCGTDICDVEVGGTLQDLVLAALEHECCALCPRCGRNQLDPTPVRNSLSREDSDTYICTPCGTDEAMRGLDGLPAWPGYPNVMPTPEGK